MWRPVVLAVPRRVAARAPWARPLAVLAAPAPANPAAAERLGGAGSSKGRPGQLQKATAAAAAVAASLAFTQHRKGDCSPVVLEAPPQKPYQPPEQFDRPYASVTATRPSDEAGELAWAVKFLDVSTVRRLLSEWPHGATLIDSEGNSLFHLAASEPGRYAAQPKAGQEVLDLLLHNGWDVVDAKNGDGLRAEVLAKRKDPHSPLVALLERRSRDFREPLRMEKPLVLLGEQSPEPYRWTYDVQDDQRRSWAGCMKDVFPKEKLDRWLETSLRDGAWTQMEGTPRRTIWYVSEDCKDCPYKYSGLEYPATVFPPFMEEIRAEVCRECGIPPEDYPNSCNCNAYDDQRHEVAWHSDDEVMFQGLQGDTRILSFSLGVPRDFCWRLQGTTTTMGSVALGHGDIMTMEGMFQKHYKHSVPKSDQPCGTRINFTFRWIKEKSHAHDAEVKTVAHH